MTITIYTDGACSGNPGPGGWAAVIMWNGHTKEISGSPMRDTTNNAMELAAVLRGLMALKGTGHTVHIVSDSAYFVNAIQKGWLETWKRNDWQRKVRRKRKPLSNKVLWQKLDQHIGRHTVTVEHVDSHAGHAYNERADQLARAAISN